MHIALLWPATNCLRILDNVFDTVTKCLLPPFKSVDKVLGKKGEPLRDKYENDINSYLMGETIKKARQSKKLSQEQLGKLIGVTSSQVCRIENGKNLSFGTIARVFRAMGISASFDMGGYGKVALW